MEGKLRNMASVYLCRDGEILLLKRNSGIVQNTWIGSAGGHFEAAEVNDAGACVLREMEEELGLLESDLENLKLRYVTLRMKDGEIRQNYYFFADLKSKRMLCSTEGELCWFSKKDILSLEMPASAKAMMAHYLTEGCCSDRLYGAVTCETNTVFTELKEF